MRKGILILSIGLFSFYLYGQKPCSGTPAVVYEGKTYNTVQIGNQCWLKENLDVGKMIKSSQIQTNNAVIEKYCYDNDTLNCEKYGGLYQWDEAMQYVATEKGKGICPSGWHIPTKEELYDSLNVAVKKDANKLKIEDKSAGNGKGTNESGFSAILAGNKPGGEKTFSGLGFNSDLWSSSTLSSGSAYEIGLSGSGYFYLYDNDKSNGYSVRCIKDTF